MTKRTTSCKEQPPTAPRATTTKLPISVLTRRLKAKGWKVKTGKLNEIEYRYILPQVDKIREKDMV
jgi:hypothetical protein